MPHPRGAPALGRARPPGRERVHREAPPPGRGRPPAPARRRGHCPSARGQGHGHRPRAPGQGQRLAPGQGHLHRLAPGQSEGHRLAPGLGHGHRLAPGQGHLHRLAPGQGQGHRLIPGQGHGHRPAPGQGHRDRLGHGLVAAQGRRGLCRPAFQASGAGHGFRRAVLKRPGTSRAPHPAVLRVLQGARSSLLGSRLDARLRLAGPGVPRPARGHLPESGGPGRGLRITPLAGCPGVAARQGGNGRASA